MPSSRLYREFVRELICADFDGLKAAEQALEEDLARGYYAVLFCDYEFGAAGTNPSGREGFLRFLIFRKMDRLSSAAVEEWLSQVSAGKSGFIDLEPSIDETAFDLAIRTIRDRIRRGDTYQVNFTYRLKFKVFGQPLAFYRRLRARQRAAYGAAAMLPGDRWVLSFSPELFVHCREGHLTSAPIKGTREIEGEAGEDDSQRLALSLDPKSRAENLMIVDLLRNDLGRVAQIGSVTVPSLFAVERFGPILQLVSTIEAQIRRECTIGDVLTALFPCGSITGAPKSSTRKIIQELEADRRGIYTGAIGWIDAPLGSSGNRGLPDFCLSVAIRTLELEARSRSAEVQDGLRSGVVGVGAGILYDSDSALEYAECELKARFFTGMDPGFELIETIYAASRKGCRDLERHLQRLRMSAERFKFRFVEEEVRRAIERALIGLAGGPYRVRLTLNCAGETKITVETLPPISGQIEIGLAPEPIYSGNAFLRHKTTLRTAYDKALDQAARLGLYDLLFFNEHHQLCEGARSNVFLKLADGWFTPPLQAGLLPGVMRSVFLEDSLLCARERLLYWEDLFAAEAIFVCNALRGRVDCTVRKA
jgi:para-aminobenzoate synthetase/4-amino-4-deoxychorismate lyase